MAKNVTLNWDPVTTSVEGDTVDGGVEYAVYAKVSGAPDYTLLSTNPENTRIVPNLEPGTWYFMVVAQHPNYLDSEPAEVQTDIAFPALSPITNLTATVQ